MTTKSLDVWLQEIHLLGPTFADRAVAHDDDGTFVAANYADLKQIGFFRACIPTDLGGEGLSHAAMCELLRVLATYCSSTALASSMHQHLLAATLWRHRSGQNAEAMLRKAAATQPVLVSTGARDWLESNGEIRRDHRGLVVTATKSFASQSAIGDVLVTSAPFNDPEHGWQVFHFSVPMRTEGVTVLDDWRTLGMRATGSHTVRLDNVVVPESAVVLRRPRGEFHPFWNVVLTVAMPLIMAVYVGIAQKAARLAIEDVKAQPRRKRHAAIAVGAMQNSLVTAEVLWRDMLRIANNLDFRPIDEHGRDVLHRKTVVARACIEVVTQAMELVGGRAFYRSFGLERLFRDVQAARHHPLPAWDQEEFCGERLLGLEGTPAPASTRN